MNSDLMLLSRRKRVGIAAGVCMAVAAVGYVAGWDDSVWPAACLRVGIVLGSLWLCLPTETKPAAWRFLTRERLGILVLLAVFISRAKFFVPIVVTAGILLWLTRPRNRRR